MRPIALVVAVILCLSFAAGWAAARLSTRGRTPVESAREAARAGRFDDAERLYLELVARTPGDLPLVVELLDNHGQLVRGSAVHESSKYEPRVWRTIDEERIDAVVSSPALQADDALLARWWRHVTTGDEAAEERALVTAAADRSPPAPWANHLLGRALLDDDDREEAAGRFAREASSFSGRKEDASTACLLWMQDGARDRMAAAFEDPLFARQVPAGVHLDDALARHDWPRAARWFFPAQYEGTTRGILLLAALSGLVWFAFCAAIGRIAERPRLRIPLYLAAFVLGVGSAYVALAASIVEESVFHFVERGDTALDVIYFVFGVGLREELAKALLFAALLPVLKRFGNRRDALACGALVGLGFAAEENLGYFHVGLSTALARFLTANFLHLSTTGLAAIAIDDALRGREDPTHGWTQTLPLVVITHGVYDFFLSGPYGDSASFVSMFVFLLLANRLVGVIRTLRGREGPLLQYFLVGLALVAGATFVYAASLVGVAHAATDIAAGMLGVAIVAYIFGRELASL